MDEYISAGVIGQHAGYCIRSAVLRRSGGSGPAGRGGRQPRRACGGNVSTGF